MRGHGWRLRCIGRRARRHARSAGSCARRRGDGLHVDRVGRLEHPARVQSGSALVRDDPRHHRHRQPDPHLLDRVHARGDRQRIRAVPLLPEPVRVVHARPRPRHDVPRAVRRLGRRGSLLVSPHRILVSKKSATDAGKKAFIVNRIGDFAFILGMALLWTTFRDARLSAPRQSGGTAAEGSGPRRDLPGDAAPVHRRHRQVRSDSHCTSGCRTRWKVRRRSPRSSTPRRW